MRAAEAVTVAGSPVAIQALPAITDVVARLRRGGTPDVFVLDEPPSRELSTYLTKQKITWPVYDDVDGATVAAFANFRTPSYYVLEGASRIRFNFADGEPELIAQVEALRSEGH